MTVDYSMNNAQLQLAINTTVEHYLKLRAKSHSQDHVTRDEMHKHLVALLACQHARAKMMMAS